MDPTPKRNMLRRLRIPPGREVRVGKRDDRLRTQICLSLTPTTPTFLKSKRKKIPQSTFSRTDSPLQRSLRLPPLPRRRGERAEERRRPPPPLRLQTRVGEAALARGGPVEAGGHGGLLHSSRQRLKRKTSLFLLGRILICPLYNEIAFTCLKFFALYRDKVRSAKKN